MFSIGSLYIVKTWDRDGAQRDRSRIRDAAAMAAGASEHGVGLRRTVVDDQVR